MYNLQFTIYNVKETNYLFGLFDVMCPKDGGTMLEGVQLQRLGRREAGVGRQTERFPDHRLTAEADEDRSVVRFEFIHATEALIVLFHSATEP